MPDATVSQSKLKNLLPYPLEMLSFACGIDLAISRSVESDSLPPRQATAVRKWAQRIIRSFTRITVTMYVIGYGVRRWLRFPSLASASDLFSVVFSVCGMCLLGGGWRALCKNEAGLQSMFGKRKNLRYFDWAKYAAWQLCWFWWVADDIFSVLSHKYSKNMGLISLLENIGMLAMVHVIEIQYLILMLCLQGQIIVLRRLRTLDSQLIIWQPQQIIADKMEIREMISNLNKTFAGVIATLYGKMFYSLYMSYICISQYGSFEWTHLFDVVGPTLHVAFLFDMACHGSFIINQCHLTSFKLSSFDFGRVTRKEVKQVQKIMAFNPLLDTLTIWDCCTHSKAAFTSYLGTVITCVAILLQFDYRVMARLDQDKRTYMRSAWKQS